MSSPFHATPDMQVTIARGGAVAAQCSCWWTNTPALNEQRVGAIGDYSATTDDAAAELLSRACDVLARAGCTTVVGPMDGNTWRRYRFVVDRGPEPPFFLEPDNDDAWPGQWQRAGFSTLATYSSAINDDLGREDPRTAGALERIARAGISIRSFDPARPDEDLDAIHRLSIVAFGRNVLFTPLPREEFLAHNRAMLPFVQRELVLLAERNRELVGVMFAIPDVLQATRGATVDTVILKTTAVHPDVSGMGLGGALVDLVQQAARRLGFRRAIHALMYDGNASKTLSARFARTMRRYALFTRDARRS